jgi:hypothetical protein
MRLFTAPEPVIISGPEEPKIFLAGSIEQGKAVYWQRQLIGSFSSLPVTLFNPRREEWDETLVQDMSNPVFVEQVNWELDQLEKSDIVFFYFQAGTMSPITLMELGIVATWVDMADDPPYVVLVCEPGFWRLGNVQVLCQRAGIHVFPTLERGVDHMAEVCARAVCGH